MKSLFVIALLLFGCGDDKPGHPHADASTQGDGAMTTDGGPTHDGSSHTDGAPTVDGSPPSGRFNIYLRAACVAATQPDGSNWPDTPDVYAHCARESDLLITTTVVQDSFRPTWPDVMLCPDVTPAELASHTVGFGFWDGNPTGELSVGSGHDLTAVDWNSTAPQTITLWTSSPQWAPTLSTATLVIEGIP